MESDFDWLAKPPRHKLFKVIPYKRKSSSFGYSQAIKGTWEQYKKETGNKLTQNINKDGQLVGVNNTIENVLNSNEEVSSDDIKKQLFEGNNVERNGAVKNAIERGLLPKETVETEEKEETDEIVNFKVTEKE